MGEWHTQFQGGLLDFTKMHDTAAIFECQQHPQKEEEGCWTVHEQRQLYFPILWVYIAFSCIVLGIITLKAAKSNYFLACQHKAVSLSLLHALIEERETVFLVFLFFFFLSMQKCLISHMQYFSQKPECPPPTTFPVWKYLTDIILSLGTGPAFRVVLNLLEHTCWCQSRSWPLISKALSTTTESHNYLPYR